MQKMLIGELAKRANVTLRTIRHYEELGLLGNVAQEANGYHYYDEESLERLKTVLILKQFRMKLDEIKDVIDIYFTDRFKGKQRALEILERHLAETEKKIESLETFRSQLKSNIEDVKQKIQNMSEQD